MKLIYDTAAQCLVGLGIVCTGTQVLLPIPEGFDVSDLQAFADFTLIDGQLLRDPSVILARTKLAKVSVIRLHFEAIVQRIKSDAAPYELETWDTQRSEFVAWTKDNTAPTPYVQALANARGLTLPDLMGRIAAKITAMAGLQGAQHGLEAQVASALTVAAVMAVQPS